MPIQDGDRKLLCMEWEGSVHRRGRAEAWRHRMKRRRASLWIVLGGIVAVMATVFVLGQLKSGSTSSPWIGPPAPTTPNAEITIGPRAQLMSVPPSFLGISTEYWTLPAWASELPLLERVLALVRVNGPKRLRIGGD
jgi:hypothetical protein